MSFRLRFFALHLLASAALLSALLLTLYLGWYQWPGWYLQGAELVVGLLVLVDLGVGPVATLVVASPSKPRSRLRFDMSLIILVQLAAMAYGAHTLWTGRPLYYVFSVSQVDLVSVLDIKPGDAELATSRQVALAPTWNSRVRWVWARVPEDRQELGQLLIERLVMGEDVIYMPQYFHPLAAAASTLKDALMPLDTLRGAPGLEDADYVRRLAGLGQPKESVGLLSIKGNTREGAMLFDRATGAPLAFWPVQVPSGARGGHEAAGNK